MNYRYTIERQLNYTDPAELRDVTDSRDDSREPEEEPRVSFVGDRRAGGGCLPLLGLGGGADFLDAVVPALLGLLMPAFVAVSSTSPSNEEPAAEDAALSVLDALLLLAAPRKRNESLDLVPGDAFG
jgi:hypothetical protein